MAYLPLHLLKHNILRFEITASLPLHAQLPNWRFLSFVMSLLLGTKPPNIHSIISVCGAQPLNIYSIYY